MNAWQLDHATPVGPVRLLADAEGTLISLRFIDAAGDDAAPAVSGVSSGAPSAAEALLYRAAARLDDYFAGRSFRFDLKTRPVTGFRGEVYEAVRSIPPGETRTYGEVAAMIGRPKAARAVGGALAANALLIIIPCHRVVPASGGVGAYRDGARKKSELIALEKRLCG